ncbi:hypothetical protein GCM10009830_29060 [Glycomyces endophyticus]|uniref:Secreted protein n=1 Tax=Glycomyces endophyticus TaxID=480996 RepID=A0ABP4T0F7_9ACTN
MVAPGMTPTPPVTTRVGMPSVCESTALMSRFVLMFVLPLGALHGGATVQGAGRYRAAAKSRARRVSRTTCSRWASERGPRGGRVGPP